MNRSQRIGYLPMPIPIQCTIHQHHRHPSQEHLIRPQFRLYVLHRPFTHCISIRQSSHYTSRILYEDLLSLPDLNLSSSPYATSHTFYDGCSGCDDSARTSGIAMQDWDSQNWTDGCDTLPPIYQLCFPRLS